MITAWRRTVNEREVSSSSDVKKNGLKFGAGQLNSRVSWKVLGEKSAAAQRLLLVSLPYV